MNCYFITDDDRLIGPFKVKNLEQREKPYEWDGTYISYAIYKLNRLGRFVYNLFHPQIKPKP